MQVSALRSQNPIKTPPLQHNTQFQAIQIIDLPLLVVEKYVLRSPIVAETRCYLAA
jgi:hypothetical protein